MLTHLAGLLALSRRELIALVALFLVTLPGVTARIYASDEIQYVSYLRSLWFDHDVSFENEYRYFYDRNIGRGENFHATFLSLRTEAGRAPNFGTVGSAILWAPFYAAGDLVARVMRRLGSEVAADGLSRPYIAAIAYGSAFYGFAALLLSVAAARRITSGRFDGSTAAVGNQGGSRDSSALMAGLATWFGTPLLFYMYVAPPYSHACSAFAVALFVTVWLHVRRTWSGGGAVALGLAGALMAMVREQDVFFAIGPTLDFTMTAFRHDRRMSAMAAAVAGCVAFAIGMSPQLLAYTSLNGHPGPSTLVTRKMSWHAPHALEVLTSSEHGFFFWTPIAALAIGGLALLAFRGTGGSKRIGAIALVMTAGQIYVSGSVESWTVAGAFGQRRFVALTILLTIGLAMAFRSVPRGAWRGAAAAAVILAIWWNLALTALFGTGLMNRQRLELGRNAYDAFVTIPGMAPDLARRYLTTRESFYRSGEVR